VTVRVTAKLAGKEYKAERAVMLASQMKRS
jgi:hypothetical protein